MYKSQKYDNLSISKYLYKVNLFMFDLQTTRSEYDDSEYSVRRRYNDFLWLRQRLEETYPTHLVPVSFLSDCVKLPLIYLYNGNIQCTVPNV